MENAQAVAVLVALAVLVLCAKLGGLLAERLGQASVLGELLTGIMVANAVPPLFGAEGIQFVRGQPTLAVLAEAGVLILLFDVGLEADLRAFRRVGAAAVRVAVVGSLLPLGLGWLAGAWLLPSRPTIVHVFLGAALSATSVGITARVLRDLGAMQSRAAQVIVAAAVLDDVLGLVILAVVTGVVGAAGGAGVSAVGVLGILARAVVFLGVTVLVAHYLSGPIGALIGRATQPGMLLIVGLALCFALALVAELIGLAGIVGAFAAGLLLDPYGRGVRTRAHEMTLSELMQPLTHVFVPLFFVLIGLQVDLPSLADPTALVLGGALIVAGVAGKVATAGVAGRAAENRLAVGIGMVPRGEVASSLPASAPR